MCDRKGDLDNSKVELSINGAFAYVPIRRSGSRKDGCFMERHFKTLSKTHCLFFFLPQRRCVFPVSASPCSEQLDDAIHPLFSDVIHRCLSVLAHSLMNAAPAHFTPSVSSQREYPPANHPYSTSHMTTTTTTLPPSTSIPRRPSPSPSLGVALAPRPPPGPLLPPAPPLLVLSFLEAYLLPSFSQMESLSSLLLNPLPHPPPC